MGSIYGGGATGPDQGSFTPGTSQIGAIGFLAQETGTVNVTSGTLGEARMTLDRRQIISSDYIDGSGVAAGTSWVSAVGAVVDDQSTVQAVEGSVGYMRMSVDRVLMVTGRVRDQESTNNKPHTLLVGGIVRTTPAVYGEGTMAANRMDTSANHYVTLGTSIAGELISRSVTAVEANVGSSSTRITTATTTTCLASPGAIYGVLVEAATSGTVTIYDNTAGSGTVITILPAATVAGFYPIPRIATTGITVVTSAADRVVVFTRT